MICELANLQEKFFVPWMLQQLKIPLKMLKNKALKVKGKILRNIWEILTVYIQCKLPKNLPFTSSALFFNPFNSYF